MTEIKPFIRCVDYWPGQIPERKLTAYKALIDEGQIVKHCIYYNRKTGSTTVEYDAIAPHRWILEQLAERAGEE